MKDSPTPSLLTLGALARRADVPTVRLSRLVRRGALAPDFQAGSILLFQPDRVPGIVATLNNRREAADHAR